MHNTRCCRRNFLRLLVFLPFLLGSIAAIAVAWVWGGTQSVMAAPRPHSFSGSQPANTPTSACTTAWNVVSSPDPSSTTNRLFAVAAITANDIWAVGSYDEGGIPKALTLHWDGTVWAQVPSPNVGQSSNVLIGVAAASANDVWAVGYYSSNGPTRTLILHWDSVQWSIIASPNVGVSSNGLRSVEAVSANDVWAVGYYGSGGFPRTLVEHWNGEQWSIIPSPNPGGSLNQLWGVTAISTNDVWAVGYYYDDEGTEQTMTLHWDGQMWSVVPSPNVGSRENLLKGVTALTSNNVWAVGYYATEKGVYRTLTLHWDGGQWTVVASPNVNMAFNYLQQVTISADGDAWAVGYHVGTGRGETLVLHWDGTLWHVIPSPNPGMISNDLFGVAAVSTTNVWAVGTYWDGSGTPDRTLVEHYSNPCLTPSPIPTATQPSTTPTLMLTNTPAATTPTRTPTNMPINTPTYTPTNTPVGIASPTTCSLGFTDVPLENTFYPYVRCLACRGNISGYSDGTFRPNNEVTRGQLSKIVSNTAGFNETPSSWTFQDVPPGSTFYLFIERMAGRGIIGGYPCGGEGEPCVLPQHRPYFRLNATAIRGQIAKIVANAAGLNGAPASQSFEDVPPDSTFYNWIERLVSRSVLGGYQCETAPHEPCIGPLNRPYFRPYANTTRGQASKIVANTFFPQCYIPDER